MKLNAKERAVVLGVLADRDRLAGLSMSPAGKSSFVLVAGARYAIIHNVLAHLLVRRWSLPTRGRRHVAS